MRLADQFLLCRVRECMANVVVLLAITYPEMVVRPEYQRLAELVHDRATDDPAQRINAIGRALVALLGEE